MTTPKLFQPYHVGDLTLQHRVVMCPMTRNRSTRYDHVPIVSLMKPYYAQRASTPGTLLITEATLIAAKAGSAPNVPGIWSEEQIAAWKQITDAVHVQGSFIYVQLWAMGRLGKPEQLKAEDESYDHVAPSAIPNSANPQAVPRPLTTAEIRDYVQLFAEAARNAVDKAGFDGVEVHGANGYLIDQFLQEVSNDRVDKYGATVEGRSRFGLEVVDAVVNAVGAERTGVRISPWSKYFDMGMANPIPQFSHFVTSLKEKFPSLAYIHVVEPSAKDASFSVTPSNDFIRAIWGSRPYISAGGYDRATAIQGAEDRGELIAFAKLFLANPDLPVRLSKAIPLNAYDFQTFYTPGDQNDAEKGYIDYPFASQASNTEPSIVSHL
ncbi:hypothetical protein AX16_000874 [Volvariella volvacea WC 439]|nr:hypothetical protein AX16_000874 [Volvariella volvacea WC 439]